MGTTMPRSTLFLLFTLVSSSANFAEAAVCSSDQQSRIMATYTSFFSASRAGDLGRVKAMSSAGVVEQISRFEKAANNPATLARQMGGVMPALDTAKKVSCELAKEKARLIVETEATSGSGQRVPVSSVVMFEHVQGRGWLVGDKATTNPFSAQPVGDLLKHPALHLP